MSTYLVGYDLDKPGQNYSALTTDLESFGTWWHHLDSTWLIQTSLSHTALRDRLKAHLDTNDELLVIDVTGDRAAWYGFSAKGSQWLKDNL